MKASDAIGRRQPCNRAPPGATEIVVDVGEGCGKQFAPRDDDEVDAGTALQGLVEPEHFSNQSFCAVSVDGIAQLPGGDDPKPGDRAVAAGDQQREKPGRDSQTGIEHLLKFSFPPHTLRLAETVRRHARRR